MLAPDVLVLGAGGNEGAEWMAGVLAGIAEVGGVDFTATEHVVGTSAGALLAAKLLAGVEPYAPAAGPAPAAPPPAHEDAPATHGGTLRSGLSLVGGVVATVAKPFVPHALAVARPLSTRVRAVALARVDSPNRSLDDVHDSIAALDVAFDGRLRVACVERASGRRVVFGAPGASDATVARAVQASCSLPWRQQPVAIGEREYVDGGLWSPTNLDAAPALRDTQVLCLAPSSGQLGPRPRHPAVQAAAHAALAVELLTLRSRGAVVDVVAPGEDATDDEDPRRIGYAQGLAFAS